MAKQIGAVKKTGCYDDLCFYQMGGTYYVRMKSSLDGKRVRNDPAFAQTMQYAGWMGRASKMASEVYREQPKEKRVHRLYRKLTGEAMQLLKAGKSEQEITEELRDRLNSGVQITETKEISGKRNSYADAVIKNVFMEDEAEVPVQFEDKIEVRRSDLMAGMPDLRCGSCQRSGAELMQTGYYESEPP